MRASVSSMLGSVPDGTLHNPNGYPDDLVRAAVAAADARWHERRVKSAKKAVETRQRRHQARVDAIARRLVAGGAYGPSRHCASCGRALDDADSVRRGIGSECWQNVLGKIEEYQRQRLTGHTMPRDATGATATDPGGLAYCRRRAKRPQN